MANSDLAPPFRRAGLVPAITLTKLRAAVLPLTERVITAICAAVPEYDRPWDKEFATEFRAMVAVLLGAGIDYLGNPAASMAARDDKCSQFGAYEADNGRDTQGIYTAYRTAFRMAMFEAGRILATDDRCVTALPQIYTAVFDFYIASMAVSCAAHESSRRSKVSALDRIRYRFMREISKSSGMSAHDFARLASEAGWPPGETTGTAIALEVISKSASADFNVGGVFANLTATQPMLYVPGEVTPQRAEEFRAALPGYRLAIGPTRPLEEAEESLRVARALLKLPAGYVAAGPVIWAQDHAAVLLYQADPTIIYVLAGPYLEILRKIAKNVRDHLFFEIFEPVVLKQCATITELTEHFGVANKTISKRLEKAKKIIGYRGAESTPQELLGLWIALDMMRIESPPVPTEPKPRPRPRPRSARPAEDHELPEALIENDEMSEAIERLDEADGDPS